MEVRLFILLLLVVPFMHAQDFSGKAIYKEHRKMSISFGDKKNSPNLEMQKQLQAQMKKLSQRTYTLTFNKFESTYKENESLSVPQPQSGMSVTTFGGGAADVLYKNIKENRFVRKTNIMGKSFLVQDSIQKIDWQFSDETKNIGNYTCYKATYSKEVEDIDFTTFGSGKKDEKKEKKMKTIVTTVWYTPQIPISNGPKEFGGLPGLILELRKGGQTVVCTEVVLNPSEKIVIEEPRKGKKVSQKEYDKIRKEKTKEMLERFKSKRGSDHSIEIKVSH